MRLRPVREITDRHQLKPKTGDVVRYEGVEYIVEQVGVKVLHMYRRDDPKKTTHMALVTQVMKTGENILAAKTTPNR